VVYCIDSGLLYDIGAYR